MLMVVSSIAYGIATQNTMTVKPIFNRLLEVVRRVGFGELLFWSATGFGEDCTHEAAVRVHGPGGSPIFSELSRVGLAGEVFNALFPKPEVDPLSKFVQVRQTGLEFWAGVLVRQPSRRADKITLAFSWANTEWQLVDTHPAVSLPQPDLVLVPAREDYTTSSLATSEEGLPGRLGLVLEWTREDSFDLWQKESTLPLPNVVDWNGQKWSAGYRRHTLSVATTKEAPTWDWKTAVAVCKDPWPLPPRTSYPPDYMPLLGKLDSSVSAGKAVVKLNGAAKDAALLTCRLFAASTGANGASGVHLPPYKNQQVLVLAPTYPWAGPPICLGCVRADTGSGASPYLRFDNDTLTVAALTALVEQTGGKAGLKISGGQVNVIVP